MSLTTHLLDLMGRSPFQNVVYLIHFVVLSLQFVCLLTLIFRDGWEGDLAIC